MDYANRQQDDISVKSDEEGHLKTIQDDQESSTPIQSVQSWRREKPNLNQEEQDMLAEITDSNGNMEYEVAAANLKKNTSPD